MSAILPDITTVIAIMVILFILATTLVCVQSVRSARLQLQRDITTMERDIAQREDVLRDRMNAEKELQIEIDQLGKKTENHEQAVKRLRYELDNFIVPFKFTSVTLDRPRREGERPFYFIVMNEMLAQDAPAESQAKCWRKGRRYLWFGFEARDAWNQLEFAFPRRNGFSILPT